MTHQRQMCLSNMVLFSTLFGRSSSVGAFLAPPVGSRGGSIWSDHLIPHSSRVLSRSRILRVPPGSMLGSPLAMTKQEIAEEVVSSAPSGKGKSEEAAAKAAKLREFAAELRAQAEVLEAERATERKQAARRAFDSFDKNDDGEVDVKELISGLESQLRKDFVKKMTKRMKRTPSAAEVDEKIAEMPGGALLPTELGQKLIEIYDTNGDGVLQREEFTTKDDLRLRLDSLFAERAQEARLKAAEERVREIEERGAIRAREAAKARGLALPEDFNDGPATATDKLLCALPYLLPLMDSLVFGAHIFSTYPEQLSIFQPIVAILLVYRSLPFSGLILFFALQFYASNPAVNKLVRFNLRQAINIDIAMFFPSIVGFLLRIILGDDFSKLEPVTTAGSDIVFVAVIAAVLYSIVSSAFGVLPENLPLIGSWNREGSRFGRKDDGDDRGRK